MKWDIPVGSTLKHQQAVGVSGESEEYLCEV